MGEDRAHVRIKLDTDVPVALSDFVGSFIGIGNQFEKFMAREHPELSSNNEFFVKEVRAGCIEADLVTLAGVGLAVLPGLDPISLIDRGQILAKFVKDLSNGIKPYFTLGGRNPKATKSDLADYHRTVAAIARDPKAAANIEAAVFEGDGRNVRSAFKFKSNEARIAEIEIAAHRLELETKTDKNQCRVLLKFVRPSVEAGKPGKKGGERGIIESIKNRALPILYASDMAEQRMHHEKVQLQGNIFRALFDVDVNVELDSNGKPLAYRIMEVHTVLDDLEADL